MEANELINSERQVSWRMLEDAKNLTEYVEYVLIAFNGDNYDLSPGGTTPARFWKYVGPGKSLTLVMALGAHYQRPTRIKSLENKWFVSNKHFCLSLIDSLKIQFL